MNTNELREKIYEYLGLELGSLASESGNDWERAKKEVLDDYKREQSEKNITPEKINYATISKNSNEFVSIINSTLAKHQRHMDVIATRTDLSDSDILLLIRNGSKETIMNLVRLQKLSNDQIDKIIPKSVYLVRKLLFEHQNLSSQQKLKIQNI